MALLERIQFSEGKGRMGLGMYVLAFITCKELLGATWRESYVVARQHNFPESVMSQEDRFTTIILKKIMAKQAINM